MGLKQCRNCGIALTKENTFPVKKGLEALRSKCKVCTHLESKEQKALYKKKNKERVSIYNKQYRLNNIEAINARNNKNSSIRKTKRNEKKRRLYREDYAYNIEHRYRTRIQSLLRSLNTTKGRRSLEYLGCTKEEFLQHIEYNFTEGMNWSNRELWDIDHIEPCCSFDLTKEEERLKCFHYTNLRPLWKEDNKQKIKQDILWKKEKQKKGLLLLV